MSTYGRFSLADERSSEFNAGLPVKIGIIPDVDSFGDSGDLFNHAPWRDLFIFMSSDAKCVKQIVGLASQMLLRARQTKTEFKGFAGHYSFDISGLKGDVLKTRFGITQTNIFVLKIVFATETTRVPADVLTIERFKCSIRPVIVPKMMEVGRFPATSCAIGYDAMAKDFLKFSNIYQTEDFEAYAKTGSESQEFVDLTATLPKVMIDEWKKLFSVARNMDVVSWMSYTALVSASITQKEIYQACEDVYPGTIFWAGVHCIMTDVSNKKKATEVTADMRLRFENSNFYGDFKRKQNARSIPVVKSSAYIACLESMVKVVAYYIKAGTGLSAQEVNVIDMIMKDVQTKFESAFKIDSSQTGISTNDHSAVEKAIILKSQQIELNEGYEAVGGATKKGSHITQGRSEPTISGFQVKSGSKDGKTV